MMEIKKIISNFHFLKMHKLCHVVICNWLLGKLYIVITSCKKLYNQSIWSRPYISSMCIVLMSCLVMICNKTFIAIKHAINGIFSYQSDLQLVSGHKLKSQIGVFNTRVNDIFFSHLWCLLKKFILDFDISIPYFMFSYFVFIAWPLIDLTPHAFDPKGCTNQTTTFRIKSSLKLSNQ